MPIKKIGLFLFFLLLGKQISGGSCLHPFYVSLTQVEYNFKSQTLEIGTRIFTDDLQVALKNFKTLPTATENQRLALYLKEHIQIWTNENQKVILNFIGKEEEEEVSWCYLESNPISRPQILIIQNTILLEDFPSQINMLHVKIGNKIKSTYLTRNSKLARLDFKN